MAEPRAGSGRIDVHHHILPEVYVSALASAGVLDAGGIPFPKWDAGSTLEFMDRNGIAAAVVSISSPGVHFGDDAFARDLALRVNDIAAELAREWPARFGAFATLTLPDVDGALREAERALDVLRLDGVVLLSSQSDGRYLGDPAFDPLLADLDRRAALVFVHPTVPVTSRSICLDLPGPIAEFTFDTTRAAFNLVWTGAAARFPRIRWIFSHAGGTVPFLARRFALVDAFPGMRERAPGGVLAALARFHYDTALSANPGALRSLGELVGPSQVLFGSDHPFAPEPVVAANVRGLDAYDGFDAAARRAIERDNALALLPRLAERLARS